MAQRIAIRTQNGHYVVAENGGGGVVNANRTQIGIWEVFTLAELGNGNVALQTHDGHFLTAEGSGGQAVVADRTQLGPWETFGRQDLGGGKVAFKANNGQYVCAEGGGGKNLVADRNAASTWETFEIVTNPTVVPGANSGQAEEVRAEAMPWGLVITLSHTAAQNLVATGVASAAIVAAVGGVVSAGILAAVGAGIGAVTGLVKAVDSGKGVYLTMLWVTPGLFIPTTRP